MISTLGNLCPTCGQPIACIPQKLWSVEGIKPNSVPVDHLPAKCGRNHRCLRFAVVDPVGDRP